MPNPTGKNGTPEKIGKRAHCLPMPPDNVLKKALLRYVFELELDCEVRLELPSVRTQQVPISELTQAVIDEVENDPAQLRGPDFIKDQLRLKMLLAPRDLIRNIMITHFPGGFDVRYPGRKGMRVARVPLRASGPFFEVSSDGHEKISAAALRMGGVGFSVYGFKDKYTDSVLFLKIYPDVRSSGAGGHIFLDFVESTGHIPIQLTTDKGSEVGWLYAFMSVLRSVYAPDIDPAVYPFHVLIKSVHNTVIEGFWRQFKEKTGLNLKDFMLHGKEQHLFNPHDAMHEPLFYWVFAPLIQQALDDFVDWWNHHRVRHQHDKIMPSGHVPAHALDYPELFGALDCRIAIPPEAVAELRHQLDEEEGPASKYQTFPGLTPEFNIYATEIYERMGAPALTLAGAWDIFVEMAQEIALDQAE
ncbi:hypothetical protein B0H14DRAFT_3111783 [Mycena olivaceomarginata]|nr:hypothetical protein B0H14DRAFT_3111783 [Mycena olivaceomarginata]